jgi:hypothetical protein
VLRRRPAPPGPPVAPDGAAEAKRRLDEAQERLKEEIPPPGEPPASA